MKRILVTGSRQHTEPRLVKKALIKHGPGVVVHGACPDPTYGNGRSVDLIADRFARRKGWPVEPHPADWEQHGQQAGPLRNTEMVELGADLCLAFPMPSSRGTFDCAAKAKAAGIPTIIYPLGSL